MDAEPFDRILEVSTRIPLTLAEAEVLGGPFENPQDLVEYWALTRYEMAKELCKQAVTHRNSFHSIQG